MLCVLNTKGFNKPENIINITEKAANITVSNLTLQGTRGGVVTVAGENCKLSGCTVKNAADSGINVSGTNNLVENCEVTHIGKDAILLPRAQPLKKPTPILIKSELERTGIKLLWGTANRFNHPRYMCGAGTSPNADVFAYAAA